MGWIPFFYRLCLVLSTKLYAEPFGPGGNGSPLTEVTSVLVPEFLYCPETGAFMPGFKLVVLGISAYLLLLLS